MILHVDYSPGRVVAVRVDEGLAELVAEGRSAHDSQVDLGELDAVELAINWLGGRPGVILTDNQSAVRLIAGGTPHPRSTRPKALMDRGRQLNKRLGSTRFVAWVPRTENLAHPFTQSWGVPA